MREESKCQGIFQNVLNILFFLKSDGDKVIYLKKWADQVTRIISYTCSWEHFVLFVDKSEVWILTLAPDVIPSRILVNMALYWSLKFRDIPIPFSLLIIDCKNSEHSHCEVIQVPESQTEAHGGWYW